MVPQYSNPIYDEEAERAILGAMLEDNLVIPKVMAILGNDCEVFYKIPHQLIYSAILSVYEEEGVGDVIIVGEELQRDNGLNRIGGSVYLLELVNSVPTSENAEYYAEIVKEKALRRRLIRTGKEIAASANKEEHNIDDILDKAEQLIFDIGHSEEKRGFVHIRQIVKDSLKEIEESFHNKGNLAGVPTGFVDFDILTMGLQPSDFIIIAGRPSAGKSVLAHNIAQYIGGQEQRPVAIFSLEMPKEHVCLRMLSSETRIEFHKLRMGKFSQDDWRAITNAATILGHAPIFINDAPGISVMEMRAEARRLKAEHEDLALIIIDYLQIMGGKNTERYESSYERVTEISKSLKSLARELNVPVLALSQLSRSIERRGDPRPMLSDLRECLTGDAQVVKADTGEFLTMAELAQLAQPVPVFALNQSYNFERVLMERVFQTGVKPVLKLTTRCGHSIRASKEHPFLTISGWKRLEQLKKGDCIGTSDFGFRISECKKQFRIPHSEFRIPLYWDEIENIKPDGEEMVYDGTVPKFHNFVANDFIVHNSGALEQDADLVAFIHREDYYDDNAQEGLTELIIKKQRNGPQGAINLKFIKTQMRFETYG